MPTNRPLESTSFAFLAERKTTSGASLVVDCGHGITSVVPVHEGYTVTHAMRWSHVAGELLTQELAHELNRRNGMRERHAPISRCHLSMLTFMLNLSLSRSTHSSRVLNQQEGSVSRQFQGYLRGSSTAPNTRLAEPCST